MLDIILSLLFFGIIALRIYWIREDYLLIKKNKREFIQRNPGFPQKPMFRPSISGDQWIWIGTPILGVALLIFAAYFAMTLYLQDEIKITLFRLFVGTSLFLVFTLVFGIRLFNFLTTLRNDYISFKNNHLYLIRVWGLQGEVDLGKVRAVRRNQKFILFMQFFPNLGSEFYPLGGRYLEFYTPEGEIVWDVSYWSNKDIDKIIQFIVQKYPSIEDRTPAIDKIIRGIPGGVLGKIALLFLGAILLALLSLLISFWVTT